MCSGKKHITDLDRLTSCYAFIFNVRHESLRGFDGENKGIISLLAKELLALDDGVISAYYRIGVGQMHESWKDAKINMELDDVLMVNCAAVKSLWNLVVVDGEEVYRG